MMVWSILPKTRRKHSVIWLICFLVCLKEKSMIFLHCLLNNFRKDKLDSRALLLLVSFSSDKKPLDARGKFLPRFDLQMSQISSCSLLYFFVKPCFQFENSDEVNLCSFLNDRCLILQHTKHFVLYFYRVFLSAFL
jgi:hypothetical protein